MENIQNSSHSLPYIGLNINFFKDVEVDPFHPTINQEFYSVSNLEPNKDNISLDIKKSV